MTDNQYRKNQSVVNLSVMSYCNKESITNFLKQWSIFSYCILAILLVWLSLSSGNFFPFVMHLFGSEIYVAVYT